MVTCPGTDFYTPNINVFDNIANVNDCAAKCSATQGCSIASYNAGSRTCYLKGGPTAPIWFNDAALATIRSIAGTVNCPQGARAITTSDKVSAVVCPNTDYYAPNIYNYGNVPSIDECANRCSRVAGCVIASWDRNSKTCYSKGNPTNPTQIPSGALDTVQLSVQGTNRPGLPSPAMGPLPQYPGVGKNPGKWGAVFKLPVIPVAGYVVPEWPEAKRMMVWSAWATNKFSLWSPPNGYTQFAEFNYKTGTSSARTVANTGHDMFCPGVSSLQDGRIVISGGTNAEIVSIYNPADGTFTRAADMKIGRGYQTSATLSNGKVFTIGGAFTGVRTNKVGEIYDSNTNTWTLLPGAKSDPILTANDWEGDWRTDNHAWLFPWTDGSVFHAGPSMAMNWIGTGGTGSIQSAGIRDPEADAMCGVHVMYDAVAGKIFSAGGSQSYTASPATSRAHIITITKPFVNPTVERVPDMLDPRGFANVVVLPNGQLIITGGQRVSRVFQDDDSVLAPELFDPPSKTFRRLAQAKTPRNYHAISILLADGTIFTGGGGMCGNLAPAQDESGCNRAIDHQDGEILSPPYLFNDDMTPAQRPIIFSVDSPGFPDGRVVKPGGTITVYMNYPTAHTLALIRMGSVTHSVNSDQRRIPLNNIRRTNAAHTVTLPSDSGVLLPGFYYLFAMDDKGVPSIARTIRVTL